MMEYRGIKDAVIILFVNISNSFFILFSFILIKKLENFVMIRVLE